MRWISVAGLVAALAVTAAVVGASISAVVGTDLLTGPYQASALATLGLCVAIVAVVTVVGAKRPAWVSNPYW